MGVTVIYADNLPIFPEDDDAFAYIIDNETGEFHDTAYNFESAINYIQSGEYTAVAIRDWLWGHDGSIRATTTEVQAAFDRERSLYLDCFGRE